jgi:two-component system response regulator AtoC
MVDILLAEDDRNFGAVLKNELMEGGYNVDHVSDGVEAVLNFVAKPYHFVLLDIRMPRLGGVDALKIIKKINPNIPVISFSGNAGKSEMEETIKCGAMKCLKKPFNLTQLKKYIDEILEY